ncbi:unnamed protein product [Notodromas monacha]|uniref:Uncharacterized protein n=1 Tax=Notodromas monacha TaxID=399045 RepID=A0A7R9C224_9CRUS|nr:unnamed protein product [Notodromas monacha]CAG0924711.1 unnamed protein product [Notodromas monacha]
METEVTKLVDASNLREELRQHGPNTILIRNVLRHWVLGNQATDPIITLARRNGKMTAIILKQTDSGGTTWWQIFTPDSQPNEDLQTLLTHHIDWSRDSLFFSSVPVAFQPLLHEIAAKQGVELMETDYQQKLYAVRDRKRQQRLLSSAR